MQEGKGNGLRQITTTDLAAAQNAKWVCCSAVVSELWPTSSKSMSFHAPGPANPVTGTSSLHHVSSHSIRTRYSTHLTMRTMLDQDALISSLGRQSQSARAAPGRDARHAPRVAHGRRPPRGVLDAPLAQAVHDWTVDLGEGVAHCNEMWAEVDAGVVVDERRGRVREAVVVLARGQHGARGPSTDASALSGSLRPMRQRSRHLGPHG